jgi:hypothetical protein
MKQITIRITEEQHERVKEAAYQRRTSVNALLQEFINSLDVTVVNQPAKRMAENIKKSPSAKEAERPMSVVPQPYQKPVYGKEGMRLIGVSINGKKFSLESACNEARLDPDDVKRVWKKGGTPHSAFEGKAHKSAEWDEEEDISLD